MAAWADRNNNYMTAADTILPQCVDLHLLRVLTAKATLLSSIKSQCISIDCLRLKSCLFPTGSNEMDSENNGSLGRQQRRGRQCRQ